MSIKKLSKSELSLAMAFAKLEILEVEAGRRDLLSCPGIENLAGHIKAVKDERQADPAV
jgi:hypothetical protein